MIRKEYEYRINAIVSVELVRRTASPADKAHLLKLAPEVYFLDEGGDRYRPWPGSDPC